MLLGLFGLKKKLDRLERGSAMSKPQVRPKRSIEGEVTHQAFGGLNSTEQAYDDTRTDRAVKKYF